MELHIESDSLEIDAPVHDFVRRTLAFATWCDGRRGQFRAHISSADLDGAPASARCTLLAELEDGISLNVSAEGRDLCESVQNACDRLEADLHHSRTAARGIAA